jgi:hypothetical protein
VLSIEQFILAIASPEYETQILAHCEQEIDTHVPEKDREECRMLLGHFREVIAIGRRKASGDDRPEDTARVQELMAMSMKRLNEIEAERLAEEAAQGN